MLFIQMGRLALLSFLLSTIVGMASGQGDAEFFSADFNGSGRGGTFEGSSVDPDTAQGLQFVPSDHSQALKVEAGTSISFDLGDTFPGESGAAPPASTSGSFSR